MGAGDGESGSAASRFAARVSARRGAGSGSGPGGEPLTLAQRTRSGPGSVLIAVYGIFALAATARSALQITTKFSHAPLAYSLSAFAAVVYVVATVMLVRGDGASRRVAFASCAVELVGVLVIGALSVLEPSWFPEATVWSDFGGGYGYVPLVLPVLGLLWLRRTRRG
ncbi:membrane protein [Actinosynnema pretiosum subsp. pretiosum]|nr:membrane protein [Actinosynnema pretiosum subsp. pretiosum]